jgi:hypothetical protein
MHLAGTKHRLALPWLAVYSVHFDLPDTSELLTLFAVYTSQKRCSLRPSPDKSSSKKVASKLFILQEDAVLFSSAHVWAEPSQLLIVMWQRACHTTSPPWMTGLHRTHVGLPFGRGNDAGMVQQILSICQITTSLVDFVCENDKPLRPIHSSQPDNYECTIAHVSRCIWESLC